ncbi:AGAP005936-PA [Anopheles gambiae str. PEST]|uniref:Partner of Y14 and mago n=1 Tax=Anopheles gambiae TaxID=7165 RepID=PYM_ANOGA|nr:RecName: Full=Partner of Y14 and mago; AltName: Full=Protein wibg homolog [Anopheles gambiae]EAA11365.4 AGAP005936-PA [Anopheles gambiae str. PEST]
MTTYSTDSQGKFIPATQRPDGTWRKPRRVRDGYVPQEEVPLYESKGKQFAQKPALPPGLSPEVVQKAKEKRERERLRQAREEQQRKEQQNKKQQAGALPPGVLAVDGGAVGGNNDKQKPGAKQPQQHTKSSQQKSTTAAAAAVSNNSDSTVDELASALASGAQLAGADAQQLEVAKKLRKLRKKIREIEAIETKLRSTDGPKLDKDQLEKVKRKPDILQEIEELEVQYSAGAM